MDAIPCREDQDVSHKSVANVVGEVCDPNMLGGLDGLTLFCRLCTIPLVCAGRDGCLLGIGETALEGVPDDIEEASSKDIFEEWASLTEVLSLSCETKRRFRGRKVAELDLDVAASDSVFMAAEAHIGLLSKVVTYGMLCTYRGRLRDCSSIFRVQ